MQSPYVRGLLATGLFLTTAAAVAGYQHLGAGRVAQPHTMQPPAGTEIVQPIIAPAPAPKIDLVFALDTTGSMSGLIATAKEKIWSIASSMAAAQPAPEIRIGLVAYRDRGDAYVTRHYDLSGDLDSMYSQLMEFAAAGGGDGPESVNQALNDAIHQMSWDTDANTYRVVFLVGDAPAHTDYQGERQYSELVRDAANLGVIVNTIRCGNNGDTQRQWQQIASLGQGEYFSVDQNGGALAFNTPFDQRLAELSADLDAVRLGYGDAATRSRADLKKAATDKLHSIASAATRARRAAFNSLEAGVGNLFGEQDLLVDIESGKVALEDVAEEELPATLAAMPAPQRQQHVAELNEKRSKLQRDIDELSSKRDTYLAEQAAAAPEAEDSLDYQVFEAVKEQASSKGLRYEGGPKL